MKSTPLKLIVVFMAAWTLSSVVFAQNETSPAATAPLPELDFQFARDLRISAMIQAKDDIMVGIADVEKGESYFLSVGDTFEDVTILSADYEKESVTLLKGGLTKTLYLMEDPDAEDAVPVDVWRGTGIEEYLKEHPEAIVKSTIGSFKELYSEHLAAGQPRQGMSIQDYANEYPELAEKMNREATGGYGEGIESMMAQHPELRETLEKNQSGMGSGIQSYIDQNPELANQLPQGPIEGRGPGIEAAAKEIDLGAELKAYQDEKAATE